MPLKSRLQDPSGLEISGYQTVPPPGSPYSQSATGTLYSALFDIPVVGYSAVSVFLTGTYTGQTLTFEQTIDGTNWISVCGWVANTNGAAPAPTIISASGSLTEYPLNGALRFRCRVTAISTGAIIATVARIVDRRGPSAIYATVVGPTAHGGVNLGNPVRVAGRSLSDWYAAESHGDTVDLITDLFGRLITLPYSVPEKAWNYAAASGGITNTTAVTIKAASSSGFKICLLSMQVDNASATASEMLIRDGSAGTVLTRVYVGANSSRSFKFEPPLRGTANTLMEVVMVTTATQTYVNAQGYLA